MYFKKTLFLLATARVALAKVQFLGVSIAGGEFGCQNDGTCPLDLAKLPVNDGITQMWHFVGDDAINMLRIPVSWQYLVNDRVGEKLDEDNLDAYDRLIQACLATGAYCMIDIHNYARWDGGIIGQGGPEDDDFVDLWEQLATKYAGKEKVVFELMNEPHNLDVSKWVKTCQKVVTAIRGAGAKNQMILLPGSNFDSATSLIENGGAGQLLDIKNPDGTTDNLLLDIHIYLDKDNSGTNTECTTDNAGVLTDVANYLRKRGRKGLISETGASQDASCLKKFCAQNELINENSDVFAGIVGWGAGSFDASYVMSLTPTKKDGRLVDNKLMSQCLVAPWVNSKDTVKVPEVTTSSSLPSLIMSPTATPASPTASADTDGDVFTVQVLPDVSILQTASAPDSLTTLITAPGAPGQESYSIAWAIPTSTAGAGQTQGAPGPAPTGGASSNRAMRLLLCGCSLLTLFL